MAIGFLYCRGQSVTPDADNASAITRQGAASGASIVPESDPELTAIIEAWPTLPEAVKAGIVAMVDAAMREQANTR